METYRALVQYVMRYFSEDGVLSTNTIYQQLEAEQYLRGLVVPPLKNFNAVHIPSPPPFIRLSWAGRRSGPAL